MFYKSIRFKITVLYMAILALTLSSFSILLYHNVRRGLDGNMDTLLESKAGGIAQAINTYWETYAIEAKETGMAPEVSRKRRNVNFANVAQRWVKEESTDPRLVDIIVVVFDTDGAVIASSKNTKALTEISRKNFLSVLQGRQRFDTVSSETQSGRMAFRIYTTPVFENEKVAYIVQVASPLESTQAALNNLRIALFVLLPITVLLTGVMGAFLAKFSLRDVDNIIQTIHQITAENMKLRIALPDTRDEIQELTKTFNDMLGRLDDAFTSQKRLFEDLSHELKTPLTILKGEFEVVLKRIRSQEEYGTILKSALEEVNRIISLAENLLLLARFEAKEIYFENKRLDLNLIVTGIVDNIKELAESKQVRISLDSGGPVLLDGDENQLKALFINLIDNALKYTPQNGSVGISIERGDSSAKVRIKDTGVGIPPDAIGRIFDRFYRVDRSRDRAGFGLGLSIAKSIVDAHKGAIEVESRPGQGTTFTVSLPLSR